jgi:hypothetical protein
MGMAATAAVLLATDLPLVVVGQRMLVILDSFPFLALPFFIFAGMLMERGGITQRLIDFAMIFVGRITGGLAQVLVGANMIMSGASGAATADCAATGSVLIPAMAKAGYSRAFAAALTAAASTVGPIIPPSIMFVLYGAMTNVSIGKLFVGGILPGLIMGGYLMIAAYVISRRRRYPKLPGVPLRQAARTTAGALPAVLMPVIVLGERETRRRAAFRSTCSGPGTTTTRQRSRSPKARGAASTSRSRTRSRAATRNRSSTSRRCRATGACPHRCLGPPRPEATTPRTLVGASRARAASRQLASSRGDRQRTPRRR